MNKSELKQLFHKTQKRHQEVLSMTDINKMKVEVEALETKTFDVDFWNDQKSANIVIQELKVIKTKYDKLLEFDALYDDIEVLYEFISAGEDMEEEFVDSIDTLNEMSNKLEVTLLLNSENDRFNAIIEIHPGAGGTESQDWADMLYRMYKRYAELKKYEFELLNYLAGEEAGIKSVTFAIRGENAFGYLKSENGVHRLVRISPFDSGGRRHTSFASLTIIPELDDSIDIEIGPTDLKIDTYRSSGAGGQSVNTTDSAVRITHLPTGTVVTVQNERSQIKNRETALKIIKGKLYLLELEKKKAELSSYRASDPNAFGSQIRSYVMHPYSMVKDHRTNAESGNVSKILDGDIDLFVNAYLKHQAKEE